MAELPEHPLIVFGTASFGTGSPQAKFNSATTANPVLSVLDRHQITHVDAARAYPVGSPGTCETLLGALAVPQRFRVSTKVNSWAPGSHSAQNIADSVTASLAALKTDKVDIMYLHAPDRSTSFEETCRAMDGEWRQGRFARFGVSNYSADEVEELCTICEREGWVKPSVYQGRYNPIIRSGEAELFPVLRKWGLSFYCYRISGEEVESSNGCIEKTDVVQQGLNPELTRAAGIFSGAINESSTYVAGSRWDGKTGLGVAYAETYLKPSIISAASRVAMAAKDRGIDGHAVALRWTVYHSMLRAESGDAVILGASSVEQLDKNLAAVEAGPLEDDLANIVYEVWERVQDDAARYHT
ncbi:MAG: hypothetical protein Q9211_003573 [Gyalolechia sp. 1 TL-2023]